MASRHLRASWNRRAGHELGHQVQFLRRLVRNPRAIGAITPSGPALARAMAAAIDPATDRTVVELGPGTGVFTRALLARGLAASRLTAIEREPLFAELIAARWPDVRLRRGSAFDALTWQDLAPVDAVISGLPLRNFADAEVLALFGIVGERLRPGGRFVQFTYGLRAPGGPRSPLPMVKVTTVLANVPPAHVWCWTKPD